MRILYNATLTPPMNDSSVTSGNADGWVLAAPPVRELAPPQTDRERAPARNPRHAKSRAVTPKKKRSA